MRRILVLTLLVLAFWFASLPVKAAEMTTFPDLQGHWAEPLVQELLHHDLVEGDQNGNFRPDDYITKAELTILFLKTKKIPPVAGYYPTFADIPKEHWLYPYAETAYRLGLINGVPVGNKLYFQPNDRIERHELITILLRANGDEGRVNQLKWSEALKTLKRYPDSANIPEWSQRSFAYALLNEIVRGYPDGSLLANKPATRAEAAALTARVLLQNVQKEANFVYDGKITFSYKRALTVQTTAYTGAGHQAKTFLGLPVRVGTVSVDPNVIPLGTHLYIEGYGFAVAADTGSAVKQNHIDVFLPSYEAAIAYGRQKDTRVYLLD